MAEAKQVLVAVVAGVGPGLDAALACQFAEARAAAMQGGLHNRNAAVQGAADPPFLAQCQHCCYEVQSRPLKTKQKRSPSSRFGEDSLRRPQRTQRVTPDPTAGWRKEVHCTKPRARVVGYGGWLAGRTGSRERESPQGAVWSSQ